MMVLALLVAFVVILFPASAATAAAQGSGDEGLTIVESSQSFEETWATLAEALQANPNIQVIGQLDHAVAASSAGLDLDPNRVVFFGNPALGTPLMQASRSAALDLPQRMQVFEVDGTTYVAYNSAEYLGTRHAVADVDTVPTIAGALANFAGAATGIDQIEALSASGIMAGEGLQTSVSENDFDTTWNNLVAAIESSPANLAFEVDHTANSNGVLRPTRLAIFGNPAIGTPLMNENPTIGIDLPLKIVVWQDAKGGTKVTSTLPSFLAKRHNIGGAADSLTAAETAINNFVSAATSASSSSTGDTSANQSGDASSAATDRAPANLPKTGQNPAPILFAAFFLMAGGIFLLTGNRLDVFER